jgi:hypothetical protein
METENKQYRRNIISNNAYSISSHQYKTLYRTGKETISLNSGFYREDYNVLFKELMLSEYVWINYEGNTLPVNVKSTELAYKTVLNDKLIQYKIDLEFAFDTINTVN